jgi:hypothetical protein
MTMQSSTHNSTPRRRIRIPSEVHKTTVAVLTAEQQSKPMAQEGVPAANPILHKSKKMKKKDVNVKFDFRTLENVRKIACRNASGGKRGNNAPVAPVSDSPIMTL